MKTFAKTLLAGGLGLCVSFGTAGAALPYGYGSYGSSSIAVGGCYAPAAHGRSDTGCDDFAYHPTSYGRSAYGSSTPSRPFSEDRFHTLPYSPGRGTSYGGRDDDCGNGTAGRRPSRPSPSHGGRHEDRYDGSPPFEPWRPLNASRRPDRRTW